MKAIARPIVVAAALTLGCGCAARQTGGTAQAPAAAAVAKAGAPAAPVAAPDLSYWRNRTDLIKPPAPPAAAELPLANLVRWKLRNGLDVIVVPRPELPVVSFSMAVKAGAYDEDAASLGLAEFTAAMLRKGTKTRSADEIADAIDFVGASIEGTSTDESSSAACTSLSKDAPLCLDLLSDVIQHPEFPDEEMDEIRDQLMGSIRNRLDSPDLLAAAHFANLVFGEDHPGGRIITPEHVRAIKRDDLRRFWNRYYRPNNSILAVAGAVDPAAIKAEIERRFGSWQAAAIPVRPAFAMPDRKGARLLLVDRDDLTQATLVFGHRGLRHGDPEWYAATLLNYVLGGSDLSSRLMTEVRARRGLTYDISSGFGASLYDGAFQVSASTRNETAWAAFLAAVAEIRRLKADGPTASELGRGKAFFAGSYPFALQSAPSLAGSIVGAELHGLGIPYVKQFPLRIARVDSARARQAAEHFLQPDNLVLVIVGRADTIAPQLDGAGMKYERIGYRDPISYAQRARVRTGARRAVTSGERERALDLIRGGLEAQGGEKKLRALRDVVIVKAGVRHQGELIVDMLSTTYYQRPDRVRVEQDMVLATGKTRTVVVVTPQGVKGGAAGQPLEPVPPVNEARLQAAVFEDVNFVLLNILDAKPPLPMELAPAVTASGFTLEGVLVRLPSGEWTTLYFDARTHLLVRVRSPGDDGQDTVSDIGDYRDVGGGLKFSFKQVTPGPTQSDATVSEIKINQGLPASLFP